MSSESSVTQNIYYVAKEPMLKAVETLKQEGITSEQEKKTFDTEFCRSLLSPESAEGVDLEKVMMVPIDLSAADEIVQEKLAAEEKAEASEAEDAAELSFDEQLVKHLGEVGAVKAIVKSYERLDAHIKEMEEKSKSKEELEDVPREMSLGQWLEVLKMSNHDLEEEEEEDLEALLAGMEDMSELPEDEEEEGDEKEEEGEGKKRVREEEETEAPNSKKTKTE